MQLLAQRHREKEHRARLGNARHLLKTDSRIRRVFQDLRAEDAVESAIRERECQCRSHDIGMFDAMNRRRHVRAPMFLNIRKAGAIWLFPAADIEKAAEETRALGPDKSRNLTLGDVARMEVGIAKRPFDA